MFTLLPLLGGACVPSTDGPMDPGTTQSPDPTTPSPAVDRDGDGYLSVDDGGDDCDDSNAFVNPGALEKCGGVDEDCDGQLDVGAVDAPVWRVDQDGDGFGDDADPGVSSCEPLEDRVEAGGDCDDLDPARSPGAPEVCNGVDDDCNLTTIETVQVAGVPYASVQDALAAAEDDAVLEVCDGTIAEVGLVVDHRVTVQSHSGILGDVVFDAGGLGPVFEVLSAAELTLVGVVVTRAEGSAVTAFGSTISVVGSRFERNRGVSGGAIAGTIVSITDSEFTENAADQGGAIWVAADGALTVSDSTFSSNTASGYGGAIQSFATTALTGVGVMQNDAYAGGGVAMEGGSLTLTATTFEGNTVEWTGAGVWAWNTSVVADADTAFVSNESGDSGGGATLLSDLGPSTWTGGTFTGNEAEAGGGMYVYTEASGTSTVSSITLEANRAWSTGGGIYVDGPATFTDSLVVGNIGGNNGGGGMSLNFNGAGASQHTVERVTLLENTAGIGGGADIYNTAAVLRDCVLWNNAADAGGGLFVWSGATVDVSNSDFGTGDTDNTPDDVSLGGSAAATYTAFAAGSTFTCSAGPLVCQ